MRLEPVYVLGPKPKPPSIPTRRAFLIAAGAFGAGVGLGGVGGYVLEIGGPTSDSPRPTGDVLLDELQRLAVEAPIEELAARYAFILSFIPSTYPRDAVLWRGAGRLAEYVIATERLHDRRTVAQWLAQVIESGDPVAAASLRSRISQLRAIR